LLGGGNGQQVPNRVLAAQQLVADDFLSDLIHFGFDVLAKPFLGKC
jgi:hypothetical protein